MKTTQAPKETLLVWTIIVSLFTIIIMISVKIERLRESHYLKKRQNTESFHSGSKDEFLNQQGYLLVNASNELLIALRLTKRTDYYKHAGNIILSAKRPTLISKKQNH